MLSGRVHIPTKKIRRSVRPEGRICSVDLLTAESRSAPVINLIAVMSRFWETNELRSDLSCISFEKRQ